MDLKFFYLVEVNLKHPSIKKLQIATQFESQEWLTFSSTPFNDDKSCIDSCMGFLKEKTKEFNKSSHKVTLIYEENPILSCTEEELDTIDADDFDRNALAQMTIHDKEYSKDNELDWLMKASVLVYGIEDENIPASGRLH